MESGEKSCHSETLFSFIRQTTGLRILRKMVQTIEIMEDFDDARPSYNEMKDKQFRVISAEVLKYM